MVSNEIEMKGNHPSYSIWKHQNLSGFQTNRVFLHYEGREEEDSCGAEEADKANEF